MGNISSLFLKHFAFVTLFLFSEKIFKRKKKIVVKIKLNKCQKNIEIMGYRGWILDYVNTIWNIFGNERVTWNPVE